MTQSLFDRVSFPWSSNLQIEIALTGLASKIFVAAIAIVGWPQTSDRSTDYPATGALQIASPYRDEAAEALQRVIRGMKPSFNFDLRCLDC
jgi:hypothetical protein